MLPQQRWGEISIIWKGLRRYTLVEGDDDQFSKLTPDIIAHLLAGEIEDPLEGYDGDETHCRECVRDVDFSLPANLLTSKCQVVRFPVEM